MARRSRKQRVVLRPKRRDALQNRARAVMIQGLAGAVAVGVAFGLMTKSDSFFSRFVERHTPALQVAAPKNLQGLWVEPEFPRNHFWIWLPWTETRARQRLLAKYPGVGGVNIHRDFAANIVEVRLEPRTPLVRWADRGIDGEGVVFPIEPDSWAQLPRAELGTSVSPGVLGPWLAQLAKQADLWSRVINVSTMPSGDVQLQMNTGTLVTWGEPDARTVAPKAASLLRVLEDSHQHLGGASTADLRFFEDGRIIIKPKSVV